ncbi:hypothetical protein HAX54_046359 [Datura stramonium]|uniref:Uncharacterized protein n=1 Tax=Datura stramonium TaxID=4076 RepID=A0ABS8WKN1_DATST|nr:hypothetical protein [Datura stramonium]
MGKEVIDADIAGDSYPALLPATKITGHVGSLKEGARDRHAGKVGNPIQPKQMGRNNMHGPIPADPLIQNRPRTIYAATDSADPLEIEILANIDPKVGNSIATTEGELGGKEINNTYLEGTKIVEEEANRNMLAKDMQQNHSASTPISILIAAGSSRHAETTLNCIRQKSEVGENAQLCNTSGNLPLTITGKQELSCTMEDYDQDFQLQAAKRGEIREIVDAEPVKFLKDDDWATKLFKPHALEYI